MDKDILPVEDASELPDWRLPLSFMKSRHMESIKGLPSMDDSWRVKDRLKTWSVALALCLNIGVDPPDVVKTNPCARKECWIDPLSMSPQKAMELIGNNLQKQYERWQPRARYKQLLDPTTDEVRKLCIALRKNAKNERVLFHYNGHGVPRPTTNGEIWVFNKSYTQYIPLSVYDLQVWMGKPSVYVFDCSHAGQILESFKLFSRERESEFFLENSTNLSNFSMNCFGVLNESILLASCGAKELLPMNPRLPADLFTSCLTAPIKTALHWFCLQKIGKLIHGVTEEMLDKIPGKLNDRKTPLGELNWIFTAITDTIAWNSLSHELFQKLFRQDLLVASLFRNFLLAERIMRSYNCTPESHPYIPSTYQHPLWQAWDLAVDHIMSQLPHLIDDTQEYEPSSFFPEQLNAFQIWLLSSPDIRQPPTQLPIILQFLLSQAHRLQALELLGRYLDMGPEAVYAALSVGIFPYVLKLLASKLRELQPILVFIWAKILAVDKGCQSDLVKDGGYKYFISVLADTTIQYEYRTMAAFILSSIASNYLKGQEACLQNNVISICLSQLEEPNAVLKQWLAICLGRLWQKYDAAKWCGVRDSAHEKLTPLLWDEVPEVRAAAVFALGMYMFNSSSDGRQSNHATSIDHAVGMALFPLVSDGSPLVRMELVTSLHGLILQYEREFQIAALRCSDTEKMIPSNLSTSLTPGGWINVFIDPSSEEGDRKVGGVSPRRSSYTSGSVLSNGDSITGGGSYSSSSDSSGGEDRTDTVPQPGPGTQFFGPSVVRYHDTSSTRSIYLQIWRGLQLICADPCPKVALKAGSIIQGVHDKIRQTSKARDISTSSVTPSLSAPFANSATTASGKSHTLGRFKPGSGRGISPSNSLSHDTHVTPTTSLSSSVLRLQQKGNDSDDEKLDESSSINSLPGGGGAGTYSETNFYDWSCKYFANSLMKQPEDCDRFSESYLQREFRFLRNHTMRAESCQISDKLERSKFNDQIFVNKENKTPQELKFHPYIPQLAVLHKTSWSIWDVEQGVKLCTHSNNNSHSRITAAEFINPHDISFLLTGTDDGCVRVWREYSNFDPPALVTSWRALNDIEHGSKNVGMVIEWEQPTGLLYATGDVRYIRVWDTHKELKIQDIVTGAESCVTSLSLDHCERSLIVAGCGDGTVRLYDRRLPSSNSLVQVLREHDSWVLNVHIEQPVNNIISMSSNGDVRIWDPRFSQSTRTFVTMQGANVCALHYTVPLLACATSHSSQAIRLYNINNGETINSIKYHDGFMGQKIGPTKSLMFHPYKLWMAAGGTDGLISIYSSERKK